VLQECFEAPTSEERGERFQQQGLPAGIRLPFRIFKSFEPYKKSFQTFAVF